MCEQHIWTFPLNFAPEHWETGRQLQYLNGENCSHNSFTPKHEGTQTIPTGAPRLSHHQVLQSHFSRDTKPPVRGCGLAAGAAAAAGAAGGWIIDALAARGCPCHRRRAAHPGRRGMPRGAAPAPPQRCRDSRDSRDSRPLVTRDTQPLVTRDSRPLGTRDTQPLVTRSGSGSARRETRPPGEFGELWGVLSVLDELLSISCRSR